ncbi:hypothetical protein N7478_006910 [Penicillium angulare]|uniref:uncharacterized protein n=1 Tax=Penicillium angulare TaxID=116970 RepID=UPI002541D836|nr:uncharacterized protein N7478_006910 [Penicillium angulare]KAJ5281538.1 hypothetical protein N7478_006910 [Penicillium angulare]
MTYQDLDSLESQPTTMRRDEDPYYRDDPAFDQLAKSLGEQLQHLSSKTSRLDDDIARLGTKLDGPRVHERIRNVLQESVVELKKAGEGFDKINKWEYVNRTQRMTQNKLVTEYKSLRAQFDTLNRRGEEKLREISQAAQRDSEAGRQPYGDAEPQFQEQQLLEPQLANQSEVDFQASLIEHRETGIQAIERDTLHLGELFESLAEMVAGQGETIDSLDHRLEEVTSDTRGANTELRSANRYQKNARSKACCLFIILAIILAIIVLAVVLG